MRVAGWWEGMEGLRAMSYHDAGQGRTELFSLPPPCLPSSSQIQPPPSTLISSYFVMPSSVPILLCPNFIFNQKPYLKYSLKQM